MKKRISGIVALLACVTCFAGCDAWDKVTGLFGDKVTYNVEGAADYLYAIEIEKNEETRSDYTVPNTWTYMGVEYAVEWTVNVTSGVVIKKGETETTVDVDEMLAENLTYVLTAKLTAGDGSTASVTLERIVEAMPSTVAAPITAAPVEGTAYKYYVWQSTKQLDCYFTGKMDGFYFKTTEDFSKAIDVYVEYVTDSTTEFYPWFNHPDDNSKQYIGVKAELGTDGNMHDNLVFAASPVSSFVWDADLATITTTIIDKNGEQTAFYLGNYNTYTTISASAVSKAATSNVGHLVELVSRDVVPATEKVAQSVRTFSLSNYYFGDGTIELPVIDETFPDVAISYTVTNADYANGVLSYTAGTEDKTVTVKATFTCGEVTDEKEISFTVSPIPTGLPEAGTELTIPQILALDLTAFGNGYNNGKTESSYVVKGTVTSIKNAWSDQYNNMDVYVSDDAGNELLVYRLATQVEVGDIVTVTGSLGTYSGTNQVAAGATAEITGKVVIDPMEGWPELVENTAYKFFVEQNSLGEKYYITGSIASSRFLATTTNPYDSVDVYVEKATGGTVGYSFYFMVGETKTYINVGNNDAGKLSTLLVTENPAVYAYDTSTKVWWTTVGEKYYYLGTYGTYSTISASETSYISASNTGVSQFPAQLILASETEWTDVEKLAYEKEALTVETSVLGEKTINLPATGADFDNVTITWELTESDYATYEEGVLTLTQPILTDATVNLTATLVCGDETDTKSFEITLIAGDPVYPDTWPDLEEDTAYKFFVAQNNLGASYYITGSMSGTKYLATTVYPSEAIDVYVEKAATGYNFYFTLDEVKNYINITSDGIALVTENPTVYAYDDTTKIWWTTVSETDYYLGTYSNYNTISASKTSYITTSNTGVSQFPVQFIAASDVVDTTEDEQTDFELSKLSVVEEVSGDKEITLTTKVSVYSKVSISWSLAASDCATLSDNTLTITNPAEDTTVTVTATVTCGTVTKEKEFTIAVKYVDPNLKTTTVTYELENSTGSHITDEGTHTIDDVLSVTAGNSAFSWRTDGEIRIYASQSIYFTSSKAITSIVLNLGNNTSTTKISWSKDGTTWEDSTNLSVTSTYADFTVQANNSEYKYFKIEETSNKQVRLKTLTVTYLESAE